MDKIESDKTSTISLAEVTKVEMSALAGADDIHSHMLKVVNFVELS